MASKDKARRSRGLGLCMALMPQLWLTGPLLAQSQTSQAPTDLPSGRPNIRVAPVILAEPEVETSVSVSVGPEGGLPRQTFLRIKGLPQAARLTEGHSVSPGVWAVPLSALPALRVHAPLSSSGRTEIHLSLIAMDGGILAETKSSLVVAPAWLLGSGPQRQDVTKAVPQTRPDAPVPEVAQTPQQPISPAVVTAAAPPPPPPEPKTIPAVTAPAKQAVVQPPAPQPTPAPASAPAPALAPVAATTAPVASPPAAAAPPARTEPQAPVVASLPPPVAPARPAVQPPPPPAAAAPAPKAPPAITPADRERAEQLVQRGDGFWKQGNFAAARQFFRRAADMGLAAGALRMGATYDPVELRGLNVVGLNSDAKEAAQWYERARELGAPEAGARLSRFQTR